ncbi:MAG: flavodoxin family protein [Candidatus Omnitrophica bacterium]|nr:flavodoxin family protein [Candidatus Omnitrophota bacterium]MCM8769990.1 flavodoxin family protein [Candidatus Omnitrophota bacterium]
MELLAIYVSPRLQGNSRILLDNLVAGVTSQGISVERLFLSQLNIKFCQACPISEPGRWCRLEDDLLPVYEKVLSAKAVAIGSPIYFGSLPAQIKALIDRFQCVWLAREKGWLTLENKKPGVFLGVEASKREDFFQNARSIIKNFFATAGFAYADELFCPGMEKEGDVLSRKDCLEIAFQIGLRLAQRCR